MNTAPTTSPSPASTTLALDLSDARRLRDGLAALLRAERNAAAEFLLALSDFDRRRGWELLGHASLFAFLHVELGLSRSAAFWRLSAARLVQRFPDVIGPLRDGRLCMSTTAELAKVLTVENQADVLPRYFGLSAREAQEVTAELMPRADPPLRSVVTTLLPAPSSMPWPAQSAALTISEPLRQIVASVLTSELPARDVSTPRDDAEPLTADLRRLHVTVTRQLLKKIDAARDGLSHTIPGATTEQVLEAALDLLLEKQARARGRVKRPRKPAPSATGSRVQDQDAGVVETVDKAVDEAGDLAATESLAEPLHRREGRRENVAADVKRRLGARPGAVRVAARLRRRLWLDLPAGTRPLRGPLGARRCTHGGQPPGPLRLPKLPGGEARVREALRGEVLGRREAPSGPAVPVRVTAERVPGHGSRTRAALGAGNDRVIAGRQPVSQ